MFLCYIYLHVLKTYLTLKILTKVIDSVIEKVDGLTCTH